MYPPRSPVITWVLWWRRCISVQWPGPLFLRWFLWRVYRRSDRGCGCECGWTWEWERKTTNQKTAEHWRWWSYEYQNKPINVVCTGNERFWRFWRIRRVLSWLSGGMHCGLPHQGGQGVYAVCGQLRQSVQQEVIQWDDGINNIPPLDLYCKLGFINPNT